MQTLVIIQLSMLLIQSIFYSLINQLSSLENMHISVFVIIYLLLILSLILICFNL